MSEENLYTFENPEYRKLYWHSCSHVMAQAVKRLWPEVVSILAGVREPVARGAAGHRPRHRRGLVL